MSPSTELRSYDPELTWSSDFGMQVVKKTPTQRWYRGYGPDQYVYYAQEGPKRYLGGTFEVESYEELEKYGFLTFKLIWILRQNHQPLFRSPWPLAPSSRINPTNKSLSRVTKVPGAKVISNGIEEMKDAPGGGYIVSIEDPQGFPCNFIYGQTAPEPRPKPEKLIVNDESDKPRARKFQRFEPGPAAVHKVRSPCPQPPTPPSLLFEVYINQMH